MANSVLSNIVDKLNAGIFQIFLFSWSMVWCLCKVYPDDPTKCSTFIEK